MHLPSPQSWTRWGQVGTTRHCRVLLGKEFNYTLCEVIPGVLDL